jgi:RNA polymerase sigma-54 factor
VPEASLHTSQDLALQQRLSPQMRQSLDILQSTTLELRQLLRQELETNPTLEDETESLSLDQHEEAAGREDEELARLSASDDAYREEMILAGRTLGRNREREELRDHLYDSLQAPRTLQQHILEQMQTTEAAPEVRAAMQILLGSLDERGFLASPPEDLALQFGLRLADLEDARRLLASLEPRGLGARDLRESLMFQLEASGRGGTLAARIVRDHLEALARNRRPEIARLTGASIREVNDAAALIGSLDPNPARDFAPDDNRLVNPDLRFFPDEDGTWQVELNHDDLPRLRVSNAYKDLLADPATPPETRAFIRDKIRGGRFVIQCIEQRQETLRRIGEVLVERQREFLEEGAAHLKPLTMQQVADLVGVHETTVSRAVAGKFAETPGGIIDLRRFFTTGYHTSDGQDVANTSVKDKIAAMIAAEDPAKPLSDETIVQTLAGEGLTIARRTIAKYRDALGIPPSHLRRRHG